MFEKIKKWYTQGLWSAQMVEQAAQKGVITRTECNELIGGDDV